VSVFSVKIDVVRPYSTLLAKQGFYQMFRSSDGQYWAENFFFQ
jgi:hypothetical protein